VGKRKSAFWSRILGVTLLANVTRGAAKESTQLVMTSYRSTAHFIYDNRPSMFIDRHISTHEFKSTHMELWPAPGSRADHV